VDVQVDRLGQIQGEDAHDGLGIDDISAGHKIKIVIKLCDIVDKGLYLVNRIQ
jgi:hypothetical protein